VQLFVKIAPEIVQGKKLARWFIQINKYYLDLFKAINNTGQTEIIGESPILSNRLLLCFW
jgi:hypothetical protein